MYSTEGFSILKVEKLVIVTGMKYVYYLYMLPYLRMVIIIGVYFLMMFIADTFPTLKEGLEMFPHFSP